MALIDIYWLQETQRKSVGKWLWNVKLYTLSVEDVSDQISGSRYMVTSITSREWIFDISTTIHSILGGFFLLEGYYLPPHLKPSIERFG